MTYFLLSGLICFVKIFYSIEIKKDEDLRNKIDKILDIDRYNQEALLYLTAILFGWLIIPLWLINKFKKNQ